MIKSLEFTLKISNCLGCSFCPQTTLNAAYTSSKTTMTLEDFNTILNKLPKDVRVDFSGYSEPFLNPLACDMIGTAIVKGYEVHVYSTLMGMKSGCVDVLSVYKPHFFKVHVPDGKALVLPEEKWVQQHELFLLAKTPASYMAMGEPSAFIKRHLAVKGIPLELPNMLSRGGLLETVPVKPKKGLIRCAANRFHQNVVLPNGDVQVCCMSYDLSMPCGNLITGRYADIDMTANIYERDLNPRENSICRRCEWSANV